MGVFPLVIAVDTNVLVYAHRGESPFHDVARARLKSLAEGDTPWGIPIVAAWGFARVVTQPIFNPATAMSTAIAAIDGLLTSASARVLTPGARHWSLLREIILSSQVRGAVTTDAVLVAICREHGVDTLLTNDRDFRRFSGIRVEPLAG